VGFGQKILLKLRFLLWTEEIHGGLMPEFKEISDLGLDISRQYALYDQIREKNIIEQAETIRLKTQVETVKPVISSFSSQLFELETKNQPFGEIEPPKNFYLLQNRAYTYNLIPSMGGVEQMTIMLNSLSSTEEMLKSENKERDLEDLTQLKNFMSMLLSLEKDFIKIENDRNRLQKG
jgi:hypothetical protein